MSDEVVGRAGFHVEHTKAVAERGAILHEMMRELDQDSIVYWAKRNPSIVVEDEILNEAFVNDSQGGIRNCMDRNEVLEYGQRRLNRVTRKLRDDKHNPRTGKLEGGTITTTLVVSHLPKSMCIEVPDYYPILDAEGFAVMGANGKPLRRSRWVARDSMEARRYFMHVHEYLTREVISGGQQALLGFDIQHSETTPHAQYMFDSFAEDPNAPGKLKAMGAYDWFVHREATDSLGKVISGQEKLRNYHSGLKKFLVAKGYDVSPDFDELRHEQGGNKAEYEALKDREAVIADLHSDASEANEAAEVWEKMAEGKYKTAGDYLGDIKLQHRAAHKFRQQTEEEVSNARRRIEGELKAAERARRAAEGAVAAYRTAQQVFVDGFEDLKKQETVKMTPAVKKAREYMPSIPIVYPEGDDGLQV